MTAIGVTGQRKRKKQQEQFALFGSLAARQQMQQMCFLGQMPAYGIYG